MNKSELVAKIAEGADISKSSAGHALESLIGAITEELSSGSEVVLIGFGTYKINNRAARIGRNPQTGEALQIAAAKITTFKAGKAFKDAVNS